MLLRIPSLHVADVTARERNRAVVVPVTTPVGAKQMLPLRRLVQPVGVVDSVSSFVAQVHHDLARVFQIIDLLFQPRQSRIGKVKGNAYHRLARRTSPLVSEVANRTKLLESFAVELAIEPLYQWLQRRSFQFESEFADWRGQ